MRHPVSAEIHELSAEDARRAEGLRGYFVETHGHRPSESLIAAALANSSAAAGLTDLADPSVRMVFADAGQEPALQLQGAGDHIQWELTLARQGHLAIALAWPGRRGRPGALSAILDAGGASPTWVSGGQAGNRGGDSVHVLRVVGAPAGRYLLTVTAEAVARAPQPFALVVSGPVAGLALA
ncbi:hypothetical protein [Phenylobacterium sp.]|jgi:hypothetical protein|uniref:hypothetical protein n=1 Tax=Phenylobacterium sp. TaxID=1871053 RepID=UPI002F94A9B0